MSFAYDGAGARSRVEGFDLVVPAGQSVALVGETASGKSTVAKLIARFYDVDAGSVSLDGVDVRELRPARVAHAGRARVRGHLSFQRQRSAANIAFAKPDAPHAEDRARCAAGRRARVHLRVCRRATRPSIGERGFSLSGGQRQRIAIARAILADPRVLILDDATSAVDPEKEHEIRAAMARGDARSHHRS